VVAERGWRPGGLGYAIVRGGGVRPGTAVPEREGEAIEGRRPTEGGRGAVLSDLPTGVWGISFGGFAFMFRFWLLWGFGVLGFGVWGFGVLG